MLLAGSLFRTTFCGFELSVDDMVETTKNRQMRGEPVGQKIMKEKSTDGEGQLTCIRCMNVADKQHPHCTHN